MQPPMGRIDRGLPLCVSNQQGVVISGLDVYHPCCLLGQYLCLHCCQLALLTKALSCSGDADYTPVLMDDRRFMVFTQTPKIWSDAYTTCKNMGATLATLRTQAETDKLLSNLPNPTNSVIGAWVGLTTAAPPGYTIPVTGTSDKRQWFWVSTGSPPEWDNWASGGQPDNSGGGEGRCGGVWYANSGADSGKWNDL